MTNVEWLQSDLATELLREALAGRTSDPARLTVISSRELTTAVGRRRVVRYVVEGLDTTGPAQIIAKTFTESRRAQLLCGHLQALSSAGFGVGRFRVPELMGFLPEENLVLYRECTGIPLNEYVGNEGFLEGVRDAARWLAKLHTSSVQLPRTFEVEREVTSTQEWAAVVGRHSPELRESAERLASQWATSGRESPAGMQVPIHKDFHTGHLLVGDSVFVIDLDEARQGDQAFDLAHFCAYLELHGDQDRTRQETFLREYTRLTGWADEGSLARYGAYTWLKIAKQLALRSGPFRGRNEDSGWEVGDAVARGVACLAR